MYVLNFELAIFYMKGNLLVLCCKLKFMDHVRTSFRFNDQDNVSHVKNYKF